VTLSITTLRIMALSIETLRIIKLSITTLSIVILSVATLSITTTKPDTWHKQHSIQQHPAFIVLMRVIMAESPYIKSHILIIVPCVVRLNVVLPSVVAPLM
jgi:hypothetical protein